MGIAVSEQDLEREDESDQRAIVWFDIGEFELCWWFQMPCADTSPSPQTTRCTTSRRG